MMTNDFERLNDENADSGCTNRTYLHAHDLYLGCMDVSELQEAVNRRIERSEVSRDSGRVARSLAHLPD